MNITIELTKQDLFNIHKRLSHCMSAEETHYYLNGVYLEYKGGELVAVATTGHILGRQRLDTAIVSSAEDFNVILPRGLIAGLSAIKVNKGQGTDPATIEINGERVVISWEGQELSGKLIEGTFPNYECVIPKEPAEVVIGFSADYVMELAKAIKATGNKGAAMVLHIPKDPDRPMRVFTNDKPEKQDLVDFVLMPMKIKS